jgi:hypothetical protein
MIGRRSSASRAGVVAALVGALSLLGPGSTGAATVNITLSCYSNPELTTVTNTTGSPIEIRTIKSTWEPQDFEPIRVDRRLGPGKSIRFQSGFGATTNVLTRNFIYYDNRELDGVRVVTSIGIFRRAC